MKTNVVLNGDALEHLKEIPDESINCVMTSPPYWALRDYGVKGQLGLESTFEEYINNLCNIFDEVKRVLRKDGTCWVNLGDTYGTTSGGMEQLKRMKKDTPQYGLIPYADGYEGVDQSGKKNLRMEKCLLQIPSRFAIEMVNRGWILRNTIIWHKPNCMPSSVKDRFTVDFEYLFFFVKNKKYWFETQREKRKYDYDKSIKYDQVGNPTYKAKVTKEDRDKIRNRGIQEGFRYDKAYNNPDGKNKRTVWKIPTQPFGDYYCENCGNLGVPISKIEKEGYFGGEDKSERICEICRQSLIKSHFAIYPEAICEIPIKAGCPEFVCKKCGNAREKILEIISGRVGASKRPGEKYESGRPQRGKYKNDYKESLSNCNCNAGFHGGIVLDPFFGAGTTGLVALKQNKQFIGIEINPEYIEIAKKRLKPYLEQTKLT